MSVRSSCSPPLGDLLNRPSRMDGPLCRADLLIEPPIEPTCSSSRSIEPTHRADLLIEPIHRADLLKRDFQYAAKDIPKLLTSRPRLPTNTATAILVVPLNLTSHIPIPIKYPTKHFTRTAITPSKKGSRGRMSAGLAAVPNVQFREWSRCLRAQDL